MGLRWMKVVNCCRHLLESCFAQRRAQIRVEEETVGGGKSYRTLLLDIQPVGGTLDLFNVQQARLTTRNSESSDNGRMHGWISRDLVAGSRADSRPCSVARSMVLVTALPARSNRRYLWSSRLEYVRRAGHWANARIYGKRALMVKGAKSRR